VRPRRVEREQSYVAPAQRVRGHDELSRQHILIGTDLLSLREIHDATEILLTTPVDPTPRPV